MLKMHASERITWIRLFGKFHVCSIINSRDLATIGVLSLRFCYVYKRAGGDRDWGWEG